MEDKKKRPALRIIPAYYDIEMAAKYLSIEKMQLYKMTSRNEIPHIKIGGLLRFEKEKLDLFMGMHRVECNPDLEDKMIKELTDRVLLCGKKEKAGNVTYGKN